MKKRLVCMALAVFALSQFTACGSEETAQLGSIATANTISLNGSSIEISGSGMSVNANVITISAPGSYTVSGTLEDGQIVVDVKEETVETELILDNAHVTNLSGAAIHIETGKDLKLKFKGENSITSGSAENPSDGSGSGAVLDAEDDISINGDEGAVLKVFGYINNGIACKNDLDVKSGKIEIFAVNNGLRGADSVEIKGGELLIDAGNDGIKSTTTDKEGKGYINIKDGKVTVNAKGDGISAATELNVSGGDVRLVSEKNGVETISDVNISGGVLNISCLSDGIQAGEANSGKGNVNISGGTVLIDSYKEGLKPRGQLNVSGGTVLALSTEEKRVEGQGFSQLSMEGAKGAQVSLSSGSTQLLKLNSAYSYKSILVGGVDSPYTVTGGNTSTIID